MGLRDELLSVYSAGPEAVVAWVEQRAATQAAQIASLLETQAALSQQVQVLTTRLVELEARLKKDSHNSHKPPSSDGPAKLPRRRSRRQRSGKASGGQPGHSGTTLWQVAEPDRVVVHRASACAQCGTVLDHAPITARNRRQVFELPEMPPQVTEHQVWHQACPQCQTLNAGVFPADVTQPTQYGPRVRALAVYLQEYQHLPFERTQDYFRDVHHLPISEGTLAQIRINGAERLEPVTGAIQAALAQAPVVHVDETGLRIAGQSRWVHVTSTDTLTHYSPQLKRGQSATDAIGILPVFQGTVVHDAWPGYFRYPCAHSLCNAHLLRDLKAVSELNHQHWPDKLARLLLTIKDAVERAVQAGRTALSPRQVRPFAARYRQIVQSALRANPPPKPTGRVGRPGQGPIRSLVLRLKDQAAAVLAFMHDVRVPFDNNLAERDLRMIKIRQKISGGFRSWAGAEAFCRIRGYLSTMRKQGHNALDVLTSAFAGSLILPRLTPE